MLHFRKLFLTVTALALFASLCMTTAAPTASTLNLPASGFIGVNDNLIISQCAVGTAPTASRPTKVAENVQAVDVGDVALTAGTTQMTANDYVTARVRPLTAHFDGDAAAYVALEASTRSPSPPEMTLNSNVMKKAEEDVANPASNLRR